MSLRDFFRLRSAVPRESPFSAKACTDVGLVRAENQDSYRILSGAMCFCVADGMGGGQGGALASKWVCEELAVALGGDRAADANLAARRKIVDGAISAANARIREYASEMHYKMMGSTVAVLAADPFDPSRAAVCHIGDSRIYRLRRGVLRQLTRDHTIGATMSRMVDGEAAKALGSRSNPLTHVLTRAVGIEAGVRADWREIEIEKGDKYLLCTDGVHDMLPDGEIASAMLLGGNPGDILSTLSKGIIEAGAADNFTAICVTR